MFPIEAILKHKQVVCMRRKLPRVNKGYIVFFFYFIVTRVANLM